MDKHHNIKRNAGNKNKSRTQDKTRDRLKLSTKPIIDNKMKKRLIIIHKKTSFNHISRYAI